MMLKHVDIIMGALNPETQGFTSESNAQKSWEEAALNRNHGEGDTEAINKEEAREPLLVKQKHVLDKSKLSGLANSKPKWTRISRMDSGLRGLSEEESMNLLGKRGPSQIIEEDSNEDLEKQQRK